MVSVLPLETLAPLTVRGTVIGSDFAALGRRNRARLLLDYKFERFLCRFLLTGPTGIRHGENHEKFTYICRGHLRAGCGHIVRQLELQYGNTMWRKLFDLIGSNER